MPPLFLLLHNASNKQSFLLIFANWIDIQVMKILIFLQFLLLLVSAEAQVLFCDIGGQCQGVVIEQLLTDSSQECLKSCKKTSECSWYSFQRSTQTCWLLESCSSLDETLDSVVSGQVECPLKQGFSKLVMLTGFTFDGQTHSEVLDLDDADNDCSNVEMEFTEYLIGATGGLITNDSIIICGGETQSTGGQSDCYNVKKNSTKKIGTMSIERVGAASLVVDDQLWITGGFDAQNNVYMSTELINSLGKSDSGPDLPRPSFGHCMARYISLGSPRHSFHSCTYFRMNDSMAILIGGYDFNEALSTVYFIDLITQTWTEGPSLAVGRYLHSCTIFQFDNDYFLIAAGGRDSKALELDSVEILKLNDDGSWLSGPILPKPIAASSLISLENNTRIILVGGIDAGQEGIVSKTYQLSCMCSITSCIWTERKQRLNTPRANMVSVLVPDEFTTC